MLSLRLKGRWTPQSTQLEHRVISSLFNVVIETQRQMDPPDQNCQRTEWSLHCSMLSFRLKKQMDPLCAKHYQSTEWSMLSSGRWTTQSTLQSTMSLFNISLRLKGRWTSPRQHCQSTEWSLHCSMLSFRQSKAEHRISTNAANESTLSEHRVISSLFNVVIQTQRQIDPPSQHCQSTEWSLHCSMLSLRLKGRWTPPCAKHCSEHRVISSLFNVVIETQRQMDHPSQHVWEHRVISSLFNVVIETQRQMDPPVNTVRAQSDLFTVQCCHWKTDGPPNTVRAQSDLFTVQCCHSDSNPDGTPPVKPTVRTQSDLFTVQFCHWESQPRWTTSSKTLSEHRVISSLFNVVIQTQRQMNPLSQHCQSTEWSASLFNVAIETQRQMDSYLVNCMNPLQTTVRAQSDLFTVQCCHSDSKADGLPQTQSTLSRAQSDLFTVQCCHSDSKADGPPPGQHCQSTEWSLHCSMLSFRLKGRWTPYV